jgi:sigma-E factor negative regulatory protein RseB
MRLAVAVLGMVFAAGAAVAADDAGDWLMKMSRAARTVNYTGVLVYRGDDILETFRVTHRFGDGAERERVQSLSGEVQDILKQHDQVTCIVPKNQKLTFIRPTPKGLFPVVSRDHIERLSMIYDLKELGTARVAGRNCRGIAIVPRDDLRYGYEMWADAETAVPLKLSLVADAGSGATSTKLLEQMFFTEVDFPKEIPDSAFVTDLMPDEVREASSAAAGAIAEAHYREPVVDPVGAKLDAPRFAKLPPGYRLVRREVRKLPEDRGVVEHLVFSDGLSSVSVFRSVARVAEDKDKPLQRADQMGAVSAYSRVVGKVQITVVGEAPQRTVRMIADSLQNATAMNDSESAVTPVVETSGRPPTRP